MSPHPSRPSPTRQRMIEVAERLFAERGVEAVSLRTVVQAAGQRNNSAAHYHFGSRDGLLAAVIEHRSAAVGERRSHLIATLLSEHPDPGLDDLLRCFVQPLADVVASGSTSSPTWYLRFLAHVVELQGGHAAPHFAPRPLHLAELDDLIRARSTPLSTPDHNRRQRWLAQITLRALADHEYEIAAGRPTGAITHVVNDLVVMLVALLRAP